MRILPINPDNPEKEVIKKVVEVIERGGIIVYPTDTVYGLGVNALDEKAVKKLFKTKKRPFDKPMPVLVRDFETMKKIAQINKEQEGLLKKLLPGRITVVLHKKSIVPDILTGGSKKIGLRIPDYKFTQVLINNLDFPITTTSANISGNMPSRDVKEILSQFKDWGFKPDLVLDARALPKGQSSTVLDLTGPKPKILRAGPVTKEELLKVLNFG